MTAPAPLGRRLVAPKATAVYLGIGERTLRSWTAAGRGPTPVRIGRTLRYDLLDLDRWIEAAKGAGAVCVSIGAKAVRRVG